MPICWNTCCSGNPSIWVTVKRYRPGSASARPFGSDTNAETTTTQTVYKLDLPNATPASLDESFKLLSGMITAPALSASNIRSDVPIVLAEMRERGGAAKRVQETMRKTFYEGQLLAERNPIGTPETLQAATAQSVRAFYNRWYRPENVVIVAAGDADPDELEKLVGRWFSSWRVKGRTIPAPNFGDPVAPAGADPANPVGNTRIVVEPDLPRNVTFAILRPWRQVNDTIVYNQGLMTDALAQAIINRRLENAGTRWRQFPCRHGQPGRCQPFSRWHLCFDYATDQGLESGAQGCARRYRGCTGEPAIAGLKSSARLRNSTSHSRFR